MRPKTCRCTNPRTELNIALINGSIYGTNRRCSFASFRLPQCETPLNVSSWAVRRLLRCHSERSVESDCSTCVIQSKRSEGFYVCHSERSVESDCSTYVIQSKRSAAKNLIASRRGETVPSEQSDTLPEDQLWGMYLTFQSDREWASKKNSSHLLRDLFRSFRLRLISLLPGLLGNKYYNGQGK